MIRAFAVCAVILTACMASAQTVSPRIISQPEPEEKEFAIQEPTPASACGERECPNPSIASADKPVDKHALLKQKLAEMNCLQSEIDQLRAATGTPQQILVKLKVVEVSQSKLQKLGIDIAALRGESHDANTPFKAPPQPFEFSTIDDTEAVVAMLEKLRRDSAARVLAEPNLVVVSGRPAQFNVGGEIPIPLPANSSSNQAVEFKQYGTQLDLLAVAQGENRVRLDLRARVSELDNSKQIEVNGVTVPAISKRQIDTSLDLKFGQTGVLSGLVQRRTERNNVNDKVVDRVEEIELLFLVTPELVAPANLPLHAGVRDAAAYRTATSASEERPNERSVRVVKPSTQR